MLEKQSVPIAGIHVPVKRVKTLDPARVEALAEDILEHGQKTPISVRRERRPDGSERFVLVEGLHRLEAMRALGEQTIVAFIVQAGRR